MYEISAIGGRCSILDPTIVAKFICKSKNVNRTMNIGSRVTIFQPGVILTNCYVSENLPLPKCDKNKRDSWFSGNSATFKKICHHLSTIYGEAGSRLMYASQGPEFTYRKSAKHQETSKRWKCVRSMSNIGISFSLKKLTDSLHECFIHQGTRYENGTSEYEGFPDILPSGEYRIDVTVYSIIDGNKRNLTRSVYWGVLKTTTAEQWRK